VVNLLRPLAEQGNADAQTKLASLYSLGVGVPQDLVQA
jgi:TPR repeat protein